jgi:hypothetical protein
VVRVPGYRSRGPGFYFRQYQIFREVVSLERGPLSLVNSIEELLGRNSSGSGLESLSAKDGTNFADKRRRPVSIVHSRTKVTEYLFKEGSSHGLIKVLSWYSPEGKITMKPSLSKQKLLSF